MNKFDKNLIGVSEAAKILAVSQNTIRRLADSGKLKCYRNTRNSYRKFSKKDILEYRENSYVIDSSKGSQSTKQLSLFEFFEENPSKMKNIKAKSHPAHYLMHKYWGRKAHNVIADYIINYTNEGDVVLDPFMGSGIVPIESIKHGRRGIGVDINPMSKFIAENTVSKVDLEKYKITAKSIIAELELELGYLYETTCPTCGEVAKVEIAIWDNEILTTHRVKCKKDGIIVKKVDELDKKNITKIEAEFKHLVLEEKIDYPKDKVLQYVKRSGKETIDELFTYRALIILSQLKDKISSVSDEKIKKLLLFTFTSMLANVSNMLPGDTDKATYKSGWVISKFWTPKVHTERNIFHCFNLRINSIYRGKKELIDVDDNLIELFVQDSNNLKNIEDESIDYIFTDPPYGESIAYLALSQFWNSWLKYDVDYSNEIIIDSYRNKGYSDFSDRIYKSFVEMYRVLKDKHYLSFTFHNRDLNVWKGVMDAVGRAGFHLKDITLQEQAVSSGTQGINRMNTLTGDFVYTFFKDVSIKSEKKGISYKDSKKYVVNLIEHLISENMGLTPSKLYELLIPRIVENNAYNNDDGSVLDIEKILKDNFDYVEAKENDKLGEKFHWIKK